MGAARHQPLKRYSLRSFALSHLRACDGLIVSLLAACGGYEALQPGDLSYDTQTIDFAIEMEDSQGLTRSSSLALEAAGCPSACIPFQGGAARVPLRCLLEASASDSVVLVLHDDGEECQLTLEASPVRFKVVA